MVSFYTLISSAINDSVRLFGGHSLIMQPSTLQVFKVIIVLVYQVESVDNAGNYSSYDLGPSLPGV